VSGHCGTPVRRATPWGGSQRPLVEGRKKSGKTALSEQRKGTQRKKTKSGPDFLGKVQADELWAGERYLPLMLRSVSQGNQCRTSKETRVEK